MKKDELKELIKESIREVLYEDNIIKTLFTESLRIYSNLLKESITPVVHNNSSSSSGDNLRENLIYTKKQLNSGKRVIPETKKEKLDPLLATMLDKVDMIKD
jgi:hypothetical protein